MINFKNYLKLEKVRPLAIAAVCFIAVFIAGYGAGRMNSQNSSSTVKRSLNYTINGNTEAKTAPGGALVSPPPTSPESKDGSKNSGAADCPVKGSKSKLYHLPGGAFYERTNPDRCFATESEAQAAGFVKSSR